MPLVLGCSRVGMHSIRVPHWGSTFNRSGCLHPGAAPGVDTEAEWVSLCVCECVCVAVWDLTRLALAGIVGPMGPMGPAGQKGDTGNVGAEGPVGPKGEKGDTGAKGDKGDTGAEGKCRISGLDRGRCLLWCAGHRGCKELSSGLLAGR